MKQGGGRKGRQERRKRIKEGRKEKGEKKRGKGLVKATERKPRSLQLTSLFTHFIFSIIIIPSALKLVLENLNAKKIHSPELSISL